MLELSYDEKIELMDSLNWDTLDFFLTGGTALSRGYFLKITIDGSRFYV